MNYSDVISRELEESRGLIRVIERLKGVNGQHLVIFSHDDPDGITSAAIMARLLVSRAASVRTEFPPRFVLEPADVKAVLDEGPADLLLVLDKGTSVKIDSIAVHCGDVIVIDHHPLVGAIKRALWYNPCAELGRPYTSTSFLCHIIANIIGSASTADDFDAAIGLKADWAIDPTYGNDGAKTYVEPFVKYLRDTFPALFELTAGATLFDFQQRAKSSVLSKIAELYFAVSGGGGQYFYDIAELDGVYQPHVIFDASVSLADRPSELAAVASLDDFLAITDNGACLRACMREYKKNWQRVHRKFESTRRLPDLADTAVYLFETTELPLMPMVGSVVLGERIREDKAGEGIIVMISREKSGTHISLRGTGERINVGGICAALEERLMARFGPSPHISGGGHVKAGECRTGDSGVPHEAAVSELMVILNESN